MNLFQKLAIVISLVSVLFLSTVAFGYQNTNALNRHDKAKAAIIEAIGKEVEGKYDNVKVVQIRKSGQGFMITVYNTTKPTVTPPPPPIPCPTGSVVIDGKCVPPPSPPPEPVPTPTDSRKICLVGDIEGTAVRDEIQTQKCELVIILGDLGYDSTLSWFKTNFASNDFPTFRCVIGNHDSPEDGSSSIYKEAQALCNNTWWYKTKGVMFLGINTNGNLDNQLTFLKGVLSNQSITSGVKTAYLISHKPCYTTPSSHHNVESPVKTLCDNIVKSIPAGITVKYIAGHNHVMAESTDGLKFLSGAGGRSHYECGTNSVWNYCNNSKYGFLEVIAANGIGTEQFIDTSGNVIH